MPSVADQFVEKLIQNATREGVKSIEAAVIISLRNGGLLTPDSLGLGTEQVRASSPSPGLPGRHSLRAGTAWPHTGRRSR